jgi:uncharacterized protein YndB with AHSA1/START domain
MPAMAEQTIEAVRKSITVNASPETAFHIFTADFDSWWPRTHHLGKTPMTRGIIEPRKGGRCYTEHEDGGEVDWGTVLAWDPPRRLVFSWQIGADWKCEPDLSKASEVEIRFTPEGDGKTRVDLEHRHFERMTAGGEAMRAGVNAEGGWGSLLQLFSSRVDAVKSLAR